MSVRAYKVIIPAKLADTPSFNLWHDDEIRDFILAHEHTTDMTGEGGGTIETSVACIKELLKQKDFKLEPEYVKGFEEDIKGLNDDDFVTYECY